MLRQKEIKEENNKYVADNKDAPKTSINEQLNTKGENIKVSNDNIDATTTSINEQLNTKDENINYTISIIFNCLFIYR